MSISNQINLHQYDIIDAKKITFLRSENIQAIKVYLANIRFCFQNTKYQVRCQWWKFWWFLTVLSDIHWWITAV